MASFCSSHLALGRQFATVETAKLQFTSPGLAAVSWERSGCEVRDLTAIMTKWLSRGLLSVDTFSWNNYL